jgi:hypothetical protein
MPKNQAGGEICRWRDGRIGAPSQSKTILINIKVNKT